MHDAPTRLTDRPWLAFYDVGVPADVTVPEEPLDMALSTAAARFPQRTAIRFYRRSIAYRELDELVNRFAQALLGRGVQRGERVALLMPNCPQMKRSSSMLTHRNLVANTLQVRSWFGELADPEGADIVLGMLPLFHIYGMTTIMNFTIRGGGTMVLQPRFVLADVLQAIDREKPHRLPGVPTMYSAINHAADLHRYNLHSLKGAISGAAPLPRDVQTRFEELTGAHLVEGYGLTEASPVTHCCPLLGAPRVGTIGLPLPSTEAAVFDQDTCTRRLGPGEVGELAVRGPQVMRGYWKRPEESAAVLRDGWLFTGDVASFDADGYFAIVDRKKDMIITGGINVYPRDIEEVLYAHSKIQEAVAVGVPDERWGEAVKVYIVLEDGASATEQEIIDYCHARMARFKVPKSVEFRTELPKSLVGKVLRRELLADEARKRTASQAS